MGSLVFYVSLSILLIYIHPRLPNSSAEVPEDGRPWRARTEDVTTRHARVGGFACWVIQNVMF